MKINNASENETETRRWYIDPILLEKGWDKGSIRMEYHISSRKTINSKKSRRKNCWLCFILLWCCCCSYRSKKS